MAQLHPHPYPGFRSICPACKGTGKPTKGLAGAKVRSHCMTCFGAGYNPIHTDDWRADYDREQKLLDAIQKKGTPLLRFGVGDGKAIYAVVSTNPLILQHVPAGDGHRIPYAMIRGLRLADVKSMVASERSLNRLFGRRKAG